MSGGVQFKGAMDRHPGKQMNINQKAPKESSQFGFGLRALCLRAPERSNLWHCNMLLRASKRSSLKGLKVSRTLMVSVILAECL
eukprot:5989161-Amphidinium_carterae.1